MRTLLARLIGETEGQDLIEYALLGVLIAVAISAAMTTLAGKISDRFGTVTAGMP